jgi:hypothetical protein
MNQDFLDLLSAFNAAEVRYLVVGAYAVGVHGHPRATKDLDVWVEASPSNARKIMTALEAFGAPIDNLDSSDFEKPGTGFMMGNPPARTRTSPAHPPALNDRRPRKASAAGAGQSGRIGMQRRQGNAPVFSSTTKSGS